MFMYMWCKCAASKVYTCIAFHLDGFLQTSEAIGDMINEVLFEHVAPFLYNVEKCLLKWFDVDSKPAINYNKILNKYSMKSNHCIHVHLHVLNKAFCIHVHVP